jgi:class 3 adenylate cyclase
MQGATRDLGEPILVTEATRLMLEPPAPELESRGTIELRGKTRPVVLYGVVRGSVTISGHSSRTTEDT